jgi:preprotein translocase subunit SecG
MLEQFGTVLQGDKALQIEAKIPEKELQKIAAYLFAAFFVALLLANLITKN